MWERFLKSVLLINISPDISLLRNSSGVNFKGSLSLFVGEDALGGNIYIYF